jgi:hypothetical protein
MHLDTQSFIVRIWQEAIDNEHSTSVWRGSIDHVNSARRLYFKDWDAVVSFIQEESGLQGEQLAPQRREEPA